MRVKSVSEQITSDVLPSITEDILLLGKIAITIKIDIDKAIIMNIFLKHMIHLHCDYLTHV